jgi:methionyl-tRNA formyltransferase
MNEKKTVLVATIKKVHVSNFETLARRFPTRTFLLITKKEDLTVTRIEEMKPDIIFFPHWSWLIDREIVNRYECVIFHTSNLPHGKGGSPLQNQIVRKIYHSNVCAVRADETLDGGDIYCRRDIFLGLGSIEEILRVISETIFHDLIPSILEQNLVPEKQSGQSVVYRRRRQADSDLQAATIVNLVDLFDFVRMLDGEGYPKAFVELNNLVVELSEAHLKNGVVTGRFEAHEKENIDRRGTSG